MRTQSQRGPEPTTSAHPLHRPVRLLGEGRLGPVHVARTRDEEGNRVCLKSIRREWETKGVLARFVAQKARLRGLEHPGILRTLDAVVDGHGRHSFVIEHGEGEPISDYCARRQVGLAERVELVAQVCDLIQHAHGREVPHLDLEPANVLVDSSTGPVTVRILGFGILSALAGADGHRLPPNPFAEPGLGLEYASPEQVGACEAPVDRRSDVYSIGAMLYELLVGELPHDSRSLRSAASMGMLEWTYQDEPLSPTARLSVMGRRVDEVAAERGLDRHGLVRALGGDLERTVMRALAKDPERRHASAAELAQDLRRQVECGSPTPAPSSLASRLRRLLRWPRAAFGRVG